LDTDIFERMNIKGLIAKYNPVFRSSHNINRNITMIENMIRVNSVKADVIAYKKAVIEGRYYECFAEILIQKNLIPSDIMDTCECRKKSRRNQSFC
jgi:hypothetical protein